MRLDDSTSYDEVREKAEEKAKDVRNKIKDLTRIQSVLKKLIDSCKADNKTVDYVILKALEDKKSTWKQLR